MKRKAAERDRVLEAAWIFLAVIVFGFVIAIRIRLLGIPLERDEGEYAYAGQLLLQGIPPYKLAYNMKFPGTYAAYALIMALFGQTIVGIHLGLLVINMATILLIFLLGRRLINSIAGLAAAMTYAVLAVSPSVLGFAAHATHFVMLPVLGGTLLLLTPPRSDGLGSRRPKHDGWEAVTPCNFERLFVSGLLFGTGLLMKQPAVFFILFGALYLLSNDVGRKRGWKSVVLRNLTFDLGAAVPFGIACLFLWRAGVFDKFWFWTINYARQYGTLVPLRVGAKLFSETASEMISSTWALCALAGLGVIGGLWDKRMRAGAVFLVGFLAFSLAAFSTGFYFREHYYIFVLPAASLFAGVAITTVSDLAARRSSLVRFAPVLLFCAALGQPILAARKFYFEFSPVEASHIIYGANPFPESVRVAEYLRDHTEADDTIAVLGSEPQIYFYSKRHSATGYIYTYGLMEPQSYARQMQEEMIRQIESARPKYVIWIGVPASWLQQATSEGLILAWANDYTGKFYDVVGLVNILSRDHTDYYFDQPPSTMPQLDNYILIFRRKS
jgi:4-amino-4-deoxy-L-arabinose transferase-like glycosyltransferase